MNKDICQIPFGNYIYCLCTLFFPLYFLKEQRLCNSFSIFLLFYSFRFLACRNRAIFLSFLWLFFLQHSISLPVFLQNTSRLFYLSSIPYLCLLIRIFLISRDSQKI